ncbi:family 10 glycosylhydrolase [Melioribacteraceae bacterium 4301-Me]|uniref:family 10 glycosylhydrolase n=1 Tax=Pyranulibacter aquaticus TaxID=3163344 RepID=UPI003594BD59
MKKYLLLFLLANSIFAQFNSPKRELRGVWIASLGIDWPSQQGTSASVIANQKNQLIDIFNAHKSYGLNAIFFHVRPICDAVYKSSYEPWSNFLTGTQGVAPSDTSYDPLKFAIEEAHKRGMELHAWLNPYRAELSGGSQVSANHVINKHPEWIIKCNGSEYRFLNPGLPEVRKYVLRIVMDIVERYDVDGIHFDDYFYPYPEYGTFNDDATFASYPNGFTDKAAWRKNNVDLLLKMISDSIKAVKPWVKFGISPSGNPSVNSSIFINPADWLAGNYTDSTGTFHSGEPYIDYIMPQLYWANYGGYLYSWTTSSLLNGRHLYIGQAAYRYSEFPSGEAAWEINTNRNNPAINGGVYFSSRSLTVYNYNYIADTLKYRYFTHPAILPKMTWKDISHTKPNPPQNLRFEINSSTGKYELHWDKPLPTDNGDSAFFYAVYRSENSFPDINDSTNLFGLTGATFLSADEAKYSVTKGNYYAVTTIDRYSNESEISNVVLFDLPSLIPNKPVLASPSNGSHDLGWSTTLVWTGDSNSERYIVEVSKDSSFNSNIILSLAEYRNNQINFRNIVPGETYYWRVKAFGQVGESEYSDVFSFKSGVPLPPILISPAHATYNVSLTPVFTWHSTENATSYRIQVSTVVQLNSNFVIDTTVTDTTLASTITLLPNKKYYWHVNAKNNYGTSDWSTGFGFQTTVTSVENENIPTEFSLQQNYPNPFNPTTIISYHLPVSSHVTLKVFDLLGREVAVLVNEEKTPGNYEVKFDGSNFASGIYFYRINAGNYSQMKKMILLK